MKPLNRDAAIAKTRRNLPHWEQPGCTYFVTWRLGDAIPQDKVRGWIAERDQWVKLNPKPWSQETQHIYNREFVGKIERWLDTGYGACVLRDPVVRGILEKALHFFQGERYELEAAVIMPNHVHVLVTPRCEVEFPSGVPAPSQAGKPVSQCDTAFLGCERLPKSDTSADTGRGAQAGKPVSHSLSTILQSWKGFSAREINRTLGQSGTLWMDENFDHAVRSEVQLGHFRRYIRENPTKANLREGEYYLWESDTGFPACAPGETPDSHPDVELTRDSDARSAAGGASQPRKAVSHFEAHAPHGCGNEHGKSAGAGSPQGGTSRCSRVREGRAG